ncbi:MAG: thioredoxin domain-containing protein [Gemmatimonadales bacterium]
MTNRLALETSPYLRQHAENPVEWYPWSAEALAEARRRDVPILLSVGYSSCHWCHVMERESFEDPAVAAVMNELFVCVKVDREERPDLDQVYMKAVQAMTGGGGWPMTVFLTPDTVPYYGGTYFPPEPRHGMPSFGQVLRAASEAYRSRRDRVVESGARLVEALERANERVGEAPAGVELLDGAYRALLSQYDSVHGGFGRAPKFPQPVTLELLLRHHARTGDAPALEMVVHTLRRMAAGGIRDHLAGGFHRYSVDARWLVPHFEKMLYDNALLASAYLAAHQVTGDDDLRAVGEETLDYVAADLRAPDGGFASARDADSEGEEGTFYVWTPDEVAAVLSADDARLFTRLYDVSEAGNFEGRNILHLPHEPEAVARSEGVATEDLLARMSVARRTLLAARAERAAPFRDDKVIVAWNGLAIRALAEAGAAWDRWDYVALAEESADFVWSALRPDGRLLHVYMDGNAKIGGFLDDHAGLGNALLSLHGVTLDARWLEATRWLCEEILARFWVESEGTVFDTASDAERLVMRPRDTMDNATPSGASLAAELLARAGHALDDDRYRRAAAGIVDYEAAVLARYGPAFGRMLSVLDRSLAEPVEVVVVGRRDDADARALVGAVHAGFHRNVTVVGRREGERGGDVPLLEGRDLVRGRSAAYVCRRYTCKLPVTEAGEVAAELAHPFAGTSGEG